MSPAEQFARLPEASLGALLGGGRALILAPHPDDESLGCGGLIAAACAAGLPPAVVILTDGAASHPDSTSHPPARLAAQREAEAREALSILGMPREKMFFLGEPDTKLTAHEALLDRLTGIAAEQKCGVVIGPWAADPHCDHEAAAVISEAVAIRAGLRLLSYPVWGWLREDALSPVTGWRLHISAQLDLKRRAIAAHASQYGRVIMDSPGGFSLPQNLLAIAARPYEVFLAP
jgi:LmbE family N-acetylglucosaminyl deacetylase